MNKNFLLLTVLLVTTLCGKSSLAATYICSIDAKESDSGEHVYSRMVDSKIDSNLWPITISDNQTPYPQKSFKIAGFSRTLTINLQKWSTSQVNPYTNRTGIYTAGESQRALSITLNQGTNTNDPIGVYEAVGTLPGNYLPNLKGAPEIIRVNFTEKVSKVNEEYRWIAYAVECMLTQ